MTVERLITGSVLRQMLETVGENAREALLEKQRVATEKK